jgi:hypothetical protein
MLTILNSSTIILFAMLPALNKSIERDYKLADSKIYHPRELSQ